MTLEADVGKERIAGHGGWCVCVRAEPVEHLEASVGEVAEDVCRDDWRAEGEPDVESDERRDHDEYPKLPGAPEGEEVAAARRQNEHRDGLEAQGKAELVGRPGQRPTE